MNAVNQVVSACHLKASLWRAWCFLRGRRSRKCKQMYFKNTEEFMAELTETQNIQGP